MSTSSYSLMRESVNMVYPEAILVAGACVSFVLASISARKTTVFLSSLLTLVLALLFSTQFDKLVFSAVTNIFHSPIDPQGPALLTRFLALGITFILALIGYRDSGNQSHGEYYGCLLTIGAGLSFVGRSNDLVILYLALEMISIPTYVLLYLPIKNRLGQEAAIKYFFLSGLSSALLLMGMSYLYGAAGSTNIAAISSALTKSHISAENTFSVLTILGICFVIAGIGFRIAAFPFHFYAPDVYQAGSTGVVGMLAVVPKVAGFVALIRLLCQADSDIRQPFDATTHIPSLIGILAVLSMTLGNTVALVQTNLKRIMAYSGIAHAGYMLMGIAGAGAGYDNEPVYFYLIAYSLMTLGFFAALRSADTTERPVETIDDIAGLAKERPLIAAFMTVSLLSMIGIPLTGGFLGKFKLFMAAISSPIESPMGNSLRILAVVAAINAAIAAFYYVSILMAIYLRTPLKPFGKGCGWAAIAAGICAICTLLLGIFPDQINKETRTAAFVANLNTDNPK